MYTDKKITMLPLLFTALTVLTAVAVQAEDSAPAPVAASAPAEASWQNSAQLYAGVFIPRRSLEGDFNGERSYTNGTSGAVVPNMSAELGWGLVAGVKSRPFRDMAFGVEGSLSQTRHDGGFGGRDYDTIYTLLGLDFKLYGNARRPFQPYLLLGYSVPIVEVREGGVKGTQVEDAVFTGTGINLGLGALYQVSDAVAFHLQPVYRILRFDDLSVGDDSGELNKKLDASQLEIEFGVTIRYSVKGTARTSSL